MRRIAYFSPLPPDPSGVADYSAELVPQLARHVDVDLYAPRPRGAAEALGGRFAVRSCAAFRRRPRRRRYDALLYQMGNSARAHGEILRTLVRHPGVVVLHEFMLHHLMREMALRRRGARAFTEELRYCYGDLGLAAARRLLAADEPPDIWSFPLFERVVDSSLGVIVHNQTTRRRILASRPEARVRVVPHHVSLHQLEAVSDESRARFRAELGIPSDAFAVASFGHLTPAKRLDLALRAFGRLRRRLPSARYFLVGEIPEAHLALHELLAGDLGAGVTATGRVELDTLLRYMAACDVAVNLRHPTGGETSGTCIRMLGLGTAVVVSNQGWFGEIPDGCCAKLDAGPDEEEQLVALLERLAADRELRSLLAANARRWARSGHRLEDSARAYAAAIGELAGSAPRPEAPRPPLAHYPPTDAFSALCAELGGAAAELGIGARDRGVLADLAATLVDLDLDGGARRESPKRILKSSRSGSG